jgi:hypothetical protein
MRVRRGYMFSIFLSTTTAAFRIVWLACYFNDSIFFESDVEDIARLGLTHLFHFTTDLLLRVMHGLVGQTEWHNRGFRVVQAVSDRTGLSDQPLDYWMERFNFAYPEVERHTDTRWADFINQRHRGIWNRMIIPMTPQLAAAFDLVFPPGERHLFTRLDTVYFYYIYTNTGVIVRHVGLYTPNPPPNNPPAATLGYVVILYHYDEAETVDTLNRMYLRGPYLRRPGAGV